MSSESVEENNYPWNRLDGRFPFERTLDNSSLTFPPWVYNLQTHPMISDTAFETITNLIDGLRFAKTLVKDDAAAVKKYEVFDKYISEVKNGSIFSIDEEKIRYYTNKTKVFDENEGRHLVDTFLCACVHFFLLENERKRSFHRNHKITADKKMDDIIQKMWETKITKTQYLHVGKRSPDSVVPVRGPVMPLKQSLEQRSKRSSFKETITELLKDMYNANIDLLANALKGDAFDQARMTMSSACIAKLSQRLSKLVIFPDNNTISAYKQHANYFCTAVESALRLGNNKHLKIPRDGNNFGNKGAVEVCALDKKSLNYPFHVQHHEAAMADTYDRSAHLLCQYIAEKLVEHGGHDTMISTPLRKKYID